MLQHRSPIKICFFSKSLAVYFASFLFSFEVIAAGSVTNENGTAEVSIASPHQYADVFLDTDRYSGSIQVEIDTQHVGTDGDLYLAALYDDEHLFMKTSTGWKRWDGSIDRLEPLMSKSLNTLEVLPILDNQNLLTGNYQIVAAYSTEQGGLKITDGSLRFQVRDANTNTLEPFQSEAAMSAYLREGMSGSVDSSVISRSTVLSFTEDASADSGSARVSTTNLQETGVDEADTIKTDGENLFLLNNCEQQVCLDVYALNGSLATATQQAQYPLSNSVVPDGMYLIQDRPGNDLLVTVGGKNSFVLWLDVWGWTGNTTELEFFNVDEPTDMQSLETLTIDGALVSSRRVGDTLYVVTRYSPYLPEFVPLPFDEETREENESVLEEATLDDLVPKVRDSSDSELDLISAQDCYLPVSSIDRNTNPSIITITGIPLDNPAGFESVCFLGGTETLYMTTDSLYLATTQWDYQRLSADALFYNPEHSTSLHKFSLDNGSISYVGSGEVEGHLGWSEDKKSFRMGENGDYLNIVTSLGDTWNETSSTRLTVLKQNPASNSLDTVNVVEGIGKPGEQLYAARFLGDRAYLVTFRLIDPLYVVDLADQDNPVIAGELEIDGYSDFLHPVSDTLLLGIGKDAVPDDGSFDFGGARGAWYQGVKLSLFDVSNPANPLEVDSLTLGERGTESTALWDHHALSFLPALDSDPARLALPVQLHDTEPAWEGWDPEEPSAWYNFTHTGLYTFDISDQGISLAGRIISEANEGDDFIIALDDEDIPENSVDDEEEEEPGNSETTRPVEIPTTSFAPIFNFYSDRSVLLDDAVFYIHEGEVLPAFWGEETGIGD